MTSSRGPDGVWTGGAFDAQFANPLGEHQGHPRGIHAARRTRRRTDLERMGARDVAPRRPARSDRPGRPGRDRRAAHHPPEPPLHDRKRPHGDGRGDASAHPPRRPGQMAEGTRAPRGGHRREAVMRQQWGRTDAAGVWPHPKPAWTIAVLLIALVSAGAVGAYRYDTIWTPLQRAYSGPYLRSALMDRLAFTTSGRYRLLEVVDRNGIRLALDDEVVPVMSSTGETTFMLTDLAMKMGDARLVWDDARYHHATLHRLLARWIYRD